MKINPAEVRKYLQTFDFPDLFREQLGWDNHEANLDILVNNHPYSLTAVAQKRGFVAYHCNGIPDRATRLKIDHQVTKTAREHFVIYTDQASGEQVWQWVRREPGKPFASRDHRYHNAQTGEALIQRLDQIAVSLEEEEDLTLPDVSGRIRSAMDVDKVTKKFYDRFKAEHTAFMKLIKGIQADADLQWYTSLMLNRLMFVYFIQKKGFLDGDLDYLRNRLAQVQQVKGKDKFQSFYRYFLLRLFHEGLGATPSHRTFDAALKQLIGRVPYLNGGYFEVHQLETNYPDLDIPDKAFEKLFNFFDQYAWHLDERPLRADNEINPDVVGYIFEKYINQKQMGAYYTKEDITEYINKNTIIPFLFDAAKKKCAVAFKPGSALWRLLQDNPDRYIYAAVRHGVIDDNGDVILLPEDIAAGIDDVAKRDGWNKAASAPYALPTETWREHVARRQRCLDIRDKLRSGEIHEINDLITLNLDIWQFARDVIVNAEGPELVRAFWSVLAGHVPTKANEKYELPMSVIDVTCGSGAFVFSALCILETLYSDCIERMRRFIEDDDRERMQDEGGKLKGKKYEDFRHILAKIATHPNERYFILKTIIINNLYGVDIMEEAVEICKLRLFLKLVAQLETPDQIEPLPDIDFNFRAGNTLVGFASLDQVKQSMEGDMIKLMELPRIEEEAVIVEQAFQQFRRQQTEHGGTVTAEDKQELRNKLAKLDDELDRYLAGEYGINDKNDKAFATWQESHQPFHWFVEFYGIMESGGFDVTVGNPPYVSTAKVRRDYAVKDLATERCPDIYAWCMERVAQITQPLGHTGMIVPLSLAFSGDFDALRSLIYASYQNNWFSSFGRIPAALFAHDVRVRNTIHLGSKSGDGQNYTTRLHRWFDSERSNLLDLMSYVSFEPVRWSGRIPKLNTQALVNAFETAAAKKMQMSSAISTRPRNGRLFFKKTAYNWLNFCRVMPPCYDESGESIPHTQFDEIYAADENIAASLFLLLNGKLQLAFWFAVGDDFHVAKWMFTDLPIDITRITDNDRQLLARIADSLESTMQAATSFKVNAGKRVGNYNLARCRSVTDESDAIFAKCFGFAHVWQDVELLYTQCVRTDFTSEG